MKKNLLYLFALICTLNFFIACSDDDDDKKPVSEVWKELNGTYEGGKNLTLKLDNGVIYSAGKSVEIEPTSETTAIIILKQVVPEATEIKVNAKLTNKIIYMNYNAGAEIVIDPSFFILSGEVTINDTKITITGNFDTNKNLTLDVSRSITSSIVDTWKLSYYPVATGYMPAVYVDILTDNPVIDVTSKAVLSTTIGEAIRDKVSTVTIYLNANSSFDVAWRPVEATEDKKLSELSIINFQYAIIDGKVMIIVDKGIQTLPEGTVILKIMKDLGININEVFASLEDLGGYYGVALNYQQEENTTSFYVSKEQLVKLSALIKPLVENSENAELVAMFQQILQLLESPTTTKFDLGLTFNNLK